MVQNLDGIQKLNRKLLQKQKIINKYIKNNFQVHHAGQFWQSKHWNLDFITY